MDGQAGGRRAESEFALREPSAWRVMASRSCASARSSTVKPGARPDARRLSRSSRAATLWKVPHQGSSAARAPRQAQRLVQQAAGAVRHLGRGAAREGQQQQPLRVGALSTSQATRAASVIVLPVPAPAVASSGPAAADARRRRAARVEFDERRAR